MNLYSTIMSIQEYISSPSHTSTFTSTGQLTPEEFVDAGDFLVYKFPTWSWQPAAPGKSVTHLPENKQFLKLRHAPCHSRLDDSFSPWNPGEAIEGVDEWEDNIPIKDGDPPTSAKVRTVDDKGTESLENHPYASTTFTLLTPNTTVPHDIAPDYREKTVTIEEFPPEGTLMATVHPCKHAEAMKRIFDSMLRRKEREEWEEVPPANSEDKEDETAVRVDIDSGLRVDQYMIVFVKFIAGVVPGVEMDYTMSI
ncbi:unnamed protein product [Tuber melanosporum]|uniref:Autophagy-related protein 3 n=1 Tax=Tuber melanosporum (strain Mel28) TaxID=656061 RepID=D5G5E7_TUBMM|nr:uncharacterized protein GSTUM_00004299001 [Tuber melanosporum]CAZ79740.1 unnamed protein product [Tuber melanosporum]